MPAIGIFRGPRLVFEYANDEMLAIIGETHLGQPIGATFPFKHALISRVYATGEALYAEMAAGAMWVIPLREGRRVVAVATHFVARLRPLPARWVAPGPSALTG